MHDKAVADPGFPRGRSANSRRGCFNLLFCKIFAKNWMKMKGFEPRGKGRVSGAPLGSATAKYFLWTTWSDIYLLLATDLVSCRSWMQFSSLLTEDLFCEGKKRPVLVFIVTQEFPALRKERDLLTTLNNFCYDQLWIPVVIILKPKFSHSFNSIYAFIYE